MNPVKPRRPGRRPTRRRPPRTAVGTCKASGKRRYPHPDPAYAAALRLSIRTGKPIRAYECPDCGDWHLTRRPIWKDPT